MTKKSSYKTNSWWSLRMVHSSAKPSNIENYEDRKQNEILKKLEEEFQNKKRRKR